jgi:choline monooxygenase
MTRTFPSERHFAEPERSWTLAAPYYFDAEVYRRELDRIFYRSWNFVCHEEMVREPGSYTTFRIGDQNVMVIRGKDGTLRAFHNVCQHRGHELLKGSGKAPVITCPYHAWSYRTDGSLRTARGTQDMPDFDPKDFGLRPVQVETFCHFVYINMDPKAAALASQTEHLERELRGYAPEIDKLTHARRLEWEIKANWKNAIDNFLECFHCNVAHPAFADLVDMPTYRSKTYGIWSSHVAHPGKPDGAAFTYEQRSNEPGFAAWWLWPNLTAIVLPGCSNFITFQMIPTGPETTHEIMDFYLLNPNPTSVEEAAIRYHNDILNPEDISVVESVQRGLHSLGYNQGRYVVDKDRSENSEHALHHFHGMVLDALAR